MNEQLLKTSGADVLSSRQNLEKPYGGVGSFHRPPPLVRPRVNIYINFSYSSSAPTKRNIKKIPLSFKAAV